MPPLPIEPVIPALAAALADRGAAVLVAPPGAGKTTRVPLALAGAPWLAGRKIVMLEPRRVAARAAARRMAFTLGEEVGRTVGFRVRADTRVGPDTTIEVVTEGVLTRMLQSDPTLDEVGLVIFDEFHERSLNADLGLALVLHARAILRPELRVLVMSATIDGAAVAALLGDALRGDALRGDAPVVVSEGRSFPVETRWLARVPDNRIEGPMARTIGDAIGSDEGDVLAFLPGAAEIRRVASLLDSGSLPSNVDVVPLYGALPGAAQDRALAPAPAGRRKVVLATAIAETSLTIDGVRVVVDSGLSRLPRFDPGPGMTRLVTVRVSRAAAEQRRGRAGRTAPGVCYRLWAEHDHHGLVAQSPPEILAADLTAFALELAVAGIGDPASLRWLTPPPDGALAHARELLRLLGALDARGRPTPHGRALAGLGIHPRLAHMVVRGAESGTLPRAARLAALLSDRDIARSDRPGADADIASRVELIAGEGRGNGSTLSIDEDALRRARADARQVEERMRGAARQSRVAAPPGSDLSVGALVALAYPDRVGRRRDGQPGRYVMRGGTGAVLAGAQHLTASEWLAIAELDGRRGEARIHLAAAIDESEVRRLFADDIVRAEVVDFEEGSGSVVARRSERLGAIVLSDVVVGNPDPGLVAAAFTRAVAARGIAALPWSEAARRTRDRLAFARTTGDDWPDVSDEALGLTLGDWLAPSLAGLRRLDDLRRLDLGALLLDRLPRRQRARLDEIAPTHLVVPTGSRIPVDYSDPRAPVLAVRLQEMFGLAETPRIAGGRVPVTLHLLSPAQRPLQVTRDLAGFWRTSYFDVRKDMRGRYPRHHWPENPMEAEPTKRAKPRT
ncbi:MAG TPA: ATP-dependent helicase HrpB [Gemmatimonadaceae bacterium]|nr:ATP-dependent helicase HrpB [Gemmatimonadaceae bacterium]